MNKKDFKSAYGIVRKMWRDGRYATTLKAWEPSALPQSRVSLEVAEKCYKASFNSAYLPEYREEVRKQGLNYIREGINFSGLPVPKEKALFSYRSRINSCRKYWV
jgi:hypothetical protein